MLPERGKFSTLISLCGDLRRGHVPGDILLTAIFTCAFLLFINFTFGKSLLLSAAGMGIWMASPQDGGAYATSRAVDLRREPRGEKPLLMILGNSMTHSATGNPAVLQAMLEDELAQPVQVENLATNSQSLAETAAIIEAASPPAGSILLFGVSELRFVDSTAQPFRLGLPTPSNTELCREIDCRGVPLAFYLRRVRAALTAEQPERAFRYRCEHDSAPCRIANDDAVDAAMLASFSGDARQTSNFGRGLSRLLAETRRKYDVRIALFLEPLSPAFLARIENKPLFDAIGKQIALIAEQQGAPLIRSPGREEGRESAFKDFGHVVDQSLRVRAVAKIAAALGAVHRPNLPLATVAAR